MKRAVAILLAASLAAEPVLGHLGVFSSDSEIL